MNAINKMMAIAELVLEGHLDATASAMTVEGAQKALENVTNQQEGTLLARLLILVGEFAEGMNASQRERYDNLRRQLAAVLDFRDGLMREAAVGNENCLAQLRGVNGNTEMIVDMAVALAKAAYGDFTRLSLSGREN